MPRPKRYTPISHDFNRDPEVRECRKRFGDWIALAWMECLAIGDRNDGIVRGTVEQIAEQLAPISLQKYLKPSAKTAQMFLKYAADLGWIRVESTQIVIVNHMKYHNLPVRKQEHSYPNLSEPNLTNPPIVPQSERKKVKAVSDEGFSLFWSEYPKHADKDTCEKIWRKLKPDDELVEKIIAAIRAQKNWRENAQPSEFRPEWKNPSTWLNKKSWDDEVQQELEEVSPGWQPFHKTRNE